MPSLRTQLAQLPVNYTDMTEQELIMLANVYKALATMGRGYDNLLTELGFYQLYTKIDGLGSELAHRAKRSRKKAYRAPLLRALNDIDQYVKPLPAADHRWLISRVLPSESSPVAPLSKSGLIEEGLSPCTPIELAALRETFYDTDYTHYLLHVRPQLQEMAAATPSPYLNIIFQIDNLELDLLKQYHTTQ